MFRPVFHTVGVTAGIVWGAQAAAAENRISIRFDPNYE
jgi:hypothetical protein